MRRNECGEMDMILLNLSHHRRLVPPSSFVASVRETANIRKLLSVLAAKEGELRGTRFIAPCVRGGEVVVRGGGLLYAFTPEPGEFEGWGVFEPVDDTTAQLVEEVGPRLIGEYLKPLMQIRLRLAYRIEGQTWAAYPVSEAEARQRLGTREARQVHLTSEGAQFEQIVARWDGAACWFEEVDRRADPVNAERLREALRHKTLPAHLGWDGCTPEMRGCYVQAEQQRKGFQQTLQQPSDEQRLREALAFGGGHLVGFHDCGDCWEVEWAVHAGGGTRTSLIEKGDLTVRNAGICLDDRDSDFDLQSLVKVVEDGDNYW